MVFFFSSFLYYSKSIDCEIVFFFLCHTFKIPNRSSIVNS